MTDSMSAISKFSVEEQNLGCSLVWEAYLGILYIEGTWSGAADFDEKAEQGKEEWRICSTH